MEIAGGVVRAQSSTCTGISPVTFPSPPSLRGSMVHIRQSPWPDDPQGWYQIRRQGLLASLYSTSSFELSSIASLGVLAG